jgi:hypothetical protein
MVLLRATVEGHLYQVVLCQAMHLKTFPFLLVQLEGFKGVATSSAMTKFPPASTKKSKGSLTNLTFAFEGGLPFIQEIKVGGRRGSDDGIS